MRERERRFEEVMKMKAGVMANRIIDLEDRVRELQDKMVQVATGLLSVARREG
jgi:hypothetical protein